MKIALSFPAVNRRGGVERVVLETARYLGAQGHDVHLYCNVVDTPVPLKVSIHHVEQRSFPWFARPLSFQENCTSALAADHFDAIGSFGVPSPLGGVYWAPSVHAAWIEYSKAYRPAMSISRWKQRLNPIHRVFLNMEKKHFAPGNYRRMITQTNAVKADLERFYNVPSDEIDVVPIGFDHDEFNVARAERERSEMRDRLGYRDSDQVFIFVANELQRKGFGPLMSAVSTLRDPRLKILVVGNVQAGPQAKLLDRLGLSDVVKFAGPTGDVAAYYAAADGFVLPTQYEAWGLVIVEAMACGLPVLTSEIAGAAVAVQPGRSGFLLQRPDDSNEIAEKLDKMLSGGLAPSNEIADSVQDYRWSAVLPRYEQILISA